MYQVDAQHTGRSPYAGPSKSVLLRTFEMSSLLTTVAGAAPPREDIQSASAIGPDGTIYLADFPGNLVALRDPGQGTSLTLVWRFHPAGGSSLHATPAVGPDGSVYLGFGAGTGTAARTTFYALKAPTSGTEASVNWSVDLGAGRMTSSPTIGPDGTIYAYSGSGKLYAISAAGEVKWTAPAGPSLRSSPALGPDGTVYLPSTDGKLYAITPPAAGAPTGSVAWTFDFGQHLGPTPLLTVTTGGAGGGGGANGIGSGASPTIGPDGTVYVGANNSNFYAIKPDGGLKWLYEAEREVAGIWSTAALSLDGKTLYFGANKGGIYALNSADGSRVWQFPIYGSVYSSPALGSNGTLYTGSTVGHVFAINSNTGQQVFDYNAGQEVWTAPSILPNGTLLVADRKGKVLLLGNG
jgi:outer membrane protein assembly factor BamB